MKDFLRREYGPFTGAVWLVVIIGGVGLGLGMRRFMAGRGGDAAAADPEGQGSPIAPDYGVSTGSPAFVGGGGTLYNQGEIVASVVEAIEAQTPPPATTDPVVTSPIIVKVPDPKPAPAPAAKPATDPDATVRNAILNIFREESLPAPNKGRLDRLVVEVKQGRKLSDIRAGLEEYKRNRPQLGIPV